MSGMEEEMKSFAQLTDEGNTYLTGGNTRALVDFVEVMPIQVPADQQYFLNLEESTVNVFGAKHGIRDYQIGESDKVTRGDIKTVKGGVSIGMLFKEITNVFLHSKKGVKLPKVNTMRSSKMDDDAYLSQLQRRPSESRADSGESRGTSGRESRRNSTFGESRGDYGESRGSGYGSSGESRR